MSFVFKALLPLIGACTVALPHIAAAQATCAPTPRDSLGPFYVAGAPLRSKVGSGHVLHGTVRAAPDCAPIAGALIEFWLTGPDGRYDDAHRAALLSGTDGTYRFESNAPPPYGGRPPHIHIKVTADGYAHLITQHYPEVGKSTNAFDLVLVPEP